MAKHKGIARHRHAPCGWLAGMGETCPVAARPRCRVAAGLGSFSTGGCRPTQDPVTSRARQLGQAAALVAGHGRIVAEFFVVGHSRALAWARRPQAAALVAELADPDRGWDAMVIGDKDGVLRAPVRVDGAAVQTPRDPLSTPEAGGRVNFGAEEHEQTMMALGLQSRRESPAPGSGSAPRWPRRPGVGAGTLAAAAVRVPARRRRRIRTGRTRRGGGGRTVDRPGGGAAGGVDLRGAAHRAQHGRDRRALNDAAVPCPSAADPERNWHRSGNAWTLPTVRRSWVTRVTRVGRSGTGSAPTPIWSTR